MRLPTRTQMSSVATPQVWMYPSGYISPTEYILAISQTGEPGHRAYPELRAKGGGSRAHSTFKKQQLWEAALTALVGAFLLYAATREASQRLLHRIEADCNRWRCVLGNQEVSRRTKHLAVGLRGRCALDESVLANSDAAYPMAANRPLARVLLLGWSGYWFFPRPDSLLGIGPER